VDFHGRVLVVKLAAHRLQKLDAGGAMSLLVFLNQGEPERHNRAGW
jgi:hypothetical protein